MTYLIIVMALVIVALAGLAGYLAYKYYRVQKLTAKLQDTVFTYGSQVQKTIKNGIDEIGNEVHAWKKRFS